MVYKYKERTIVGFKDGTRANYSVGQYGPLLEQVVLQSVEEQRKIRNPYIVRGNQIVLLYWQSKTNSIKEILIDREDFEKVRDYFWRLNHNGYPISSTHSYKGVVYLYRLLTNYSDTSKVVDHIDRNPLNNSKENLRIVTPSENCRNATFGWGKLGIQGVYETLDGRFRARAINREGKCIDRYFPTLEEAVEERKKMEEEYGYLRKFND